ncbi:DUF6766 family protein [Dictyobacter aurantiacus]|uniref:Transmembrane protein n=1 Tax=Dictyobacter aurantiacus TaxID=1936993 RepID=A0A401Z7B8_9CHLR|nr:DUF6766 family protein [Dictyobacter aurantiacus]GCE02757.1 hypothetical protein KDAU_00860 [Dictyobacter aurantiacus]
MWSFLRNHSVSSLLISLCVLSLIVQSITGYLNYNTQQQQHHQPTISYLEYAGGSDYWETVFENFEGEFISLAAYVMLTSFVVEKGAKESRKPGQKHIPYEQEEQQEERHKAQSGKASNRTERMHEPWRWLYEHSLFLAFLLLFLASFVGHALVGVQSYNSTELEHGQPAVSLWSYVSDPFFWLQSTRNWQAGFLSTGLLAAFSIFFRERNSPVSKGLEQSNEETGEEKG